MPAGPQFIAAATIARAASVAFQDQSVIVAIGIVAGSLLGSSHCDCSRTAEWPKKGRCAALQTPSG